MATELVSSDSKVITGGDLAATSNVGPCELVEGRIVHLK